MARVTTLIALLASLLWKRVRNQQSTAKEEYFLNKNFLLNIDLFEKFSGNNLEFTIETEPEAKRAEISSKITDKISQDLEIADILFTKTIYPYLMVVAKMDNKTSKAITYMFNTEKKIYEETGQSFEIKKEPYTDTVVYSLETISINMMFYVDVQFCWTEKVRLDEVYHCHDGLYYGDIRTISDVSFKGIDEQRPELQKPRTRTLSQKSISAFSSLIFRDIVTPDERTTLTIQAIDIDELDGMEQLEYRMVREFDNKQFLTNIIVYGEDLIIGFLNKIVRIKLDKDLNVVGMNEIGLKISTGIALQVNQHLDLFSMNGNDVIDIIRWDQIGQPLRLLPLNFTEIEGEKVDILGIHTSYQFTIFRTETNLIVRRFNDDEDYTRISLPEDYSSSKFLSNFNPDNTLLFAMKNKDAESFNFNIYNFSLTAIASIVVEEDTIVTLTAIEKDGKRSDEVYTDKFKIVVLEDNVKFFNKVDSNTEKMYLDESLTSEFLYIRSIPKDWFIGNNLDLESNCTSDNVDGVIQNKIYSVQKLENKKFNLRKVNKSANNIFYYEFYSMPLEDGSYSMVIQIELIIYFQRCIVSNENKLKCRTWYKIEETQMILQGILIKDRVFVYKVAQGYKVFEFDQGYLVDSFNVEELKNERSTCVYQILQKQDYIFCEDYEHRIFYIYSLTGGFKKILKMEDIYANQIRVSQRHHNYVFLNSDEIIEVRSIRTKQKVAEIRSEITGQLDNKFKICGDVLLALSTALNRYEEWNILDIKNIVKIKEVDLSAMGYILQKDTKLGYHFGCKKEYPLVVKHGDKVKAIIIRLGEIKSNSIKSVFEIGETNYYANYFIEALDLTNQERPRIVWSHLDTSNEVENVYGHEVSVFQDNQLVIDLREIQRAENVTESNLTCNLRINYDDNKQKHDITFSLKVKHYPIAVVVNEPDAGENVSEFNETLKIDLFEPVQNVRLTEHFKGEVLNFNINSTENDYERTILRYSLINNYEGLSKIMRCSRQETVVKDIYISRSGSIYALTEQAMFKIKNGTTYSVQNFMYLSSGGRDDYNCKRILLNEAKNIVISLCKKADIPYLVVSNWNSMKPSNALSKQVDFVDIKFIKFAYIRDFVVYLLGQDSSQKNELTRTSFLKYDLRQLDEQIGIDLVKTIDYEIPDYLELSDMVIFTYPDTNQKASIFVGVSGDLSTVNSARLIAMMEDEETGTVKTLFNQTFNFILNKHEEKDYSPTFSSIRNLKCTVDGTDVPQDMLLKFICVVIQIRNFHYEFEFLMNKQHFLHANLKAGYIAYGDFNSPGPMAIHSRYIVIASTEQNWIPNEGLGSNRVDLPKTYALIYERNSTSFTNTIVNGIPLSAQDPENVILKLVTLRGRDFVILSGSSYYSMVAVELKFDNSIKIYKDITTDNLTISAVNHYNMAKVHLILEDDTLKYFLIIIAVVVVVILCGVGILVCCRKGKDKSKTTFDGFDAMQFVDVTELEGDAIFDEDPEKMIRMSEEVMMKNEGSRAEFLSRALSNRVSSDSVIKEVLDGINEGGGENGSDE